MSDTDLMTNVKEALKVVTVPLHPKGWPFVAGFAVASILLALLAEPLGVLGLVATLWCVYFFRDPQRVVPQRKGLIVSPADGLVLSITKHPLPPEIEPNEGKPGEKYTRISIFLSAFDVHIQRVPIDGTITKVDYRPGKFVNASLDKASEDNERNAVLVEAEGGKNIGFVQIAGLIARRILCDLKEGDSVTTGERYGLIRFGSRVDVYLPTGVNPLVCEGQRMIGGETVLADLKSRAAARKGEVR